ncbi:ribosome rescue GTPase HflX [Pseudohaliea rubra]|uniref:GTPase HflX n=1 Tax=Pseudohaliea rubra DSM 19751 TaxID=1265313 RepID=A0A095XZJ6_9GAMM|nr:ribosome rescue GTPase HflX [Pseudohaliea rubra]KGE05186.1 GTP-binding protein HflX [Pseudohaliea rubra DSM 19751]
MFFDRPASGEVAVLVHLAMGRECEADDPREFEELVLSAGGDPVAYIMGRRDAPHPGTFVGSGKVEEIAALVHEHDAQVVIFNHTLSPSQERNLERALKCRVLDRTGLILDIFAQRARTHEGKLQVELAQLRHMSTRLVRGWTHLERQKGGIGLRGPGETQLETDRRLLRARIKAIVARLEKVRRQREQGRRSRRRAEVPTVALVGYTNAGKSTLFNGLTTAGVYAADQLFATLDPTLRRLSLPEAGPVILADTVGFISHLPHRLVDAFKATLEETRNADLLLHVVDAASEDRAEQAHQVREVLREIGAEDVPQLEVYNKIDLLALAPRIDRDEAGRPLRAWVSARDGLGLEGLLGAIGELVGDDMVARDLVLAPEQGRLRAALYRLGAVRDERYGSDGAAHVSVRLPRADWERLVANEGAP